MSSQTKPKVDGPPSGSPQRRDRIRILGGVGVLAIVLLLLGWGLTATQWAILTTNNNVREAVVNGELGRGSESHLYSIPQGVERDIYVGINYQGSSGGYSSTSGINGTLFYSLEKPGSNSTTTTQYYVFFNLNGPNGSAVRVWFTGPQGNLTQDCGGSSFVACNLEPFAQGSCCQGLSNFFQTQTAGNYTIHLLSEQCSFSTNCTATSATVIVTRALSLITYTRPFYNAGLATVIVAAVSTAAAVGFLAVTINNILNQRRKVHGTLPKTVSSPLQGAD